MITAVGCAKVNLSLQVTSPTSTGLHPIRSLVTTIDWFDTLTAMPSHEDRLSVGGPASEGVAEDHTNLVWKAMTAHRAQSGPSGPLALELLKEIPAAAGIAGGSADAAAALLLMDALSGSGDAAAVAVGLGADVPFALAGGMADLTGYGEKIEPVEQHSDFALAIVVPPVELSTPAVYRAWDELGEPTGPPIDGKWLPPSLRQRAPLANDLFPAALVVAAALGDWHRDLAGAWGRPVLMSGSGSALFSFFSTRSAASEAAAVFEVSSRAARAAVPTAVGARIIEG